MPVDQNRQNRTGQQTERHERKTKQQGSVTDLVDDFQRGQERNQAAGFLGFEAALLQQVEQTGSKAEHQSSISGKDQDDVGDEPSVVRDERGQQDGLFVQGCDKGQEEHNGEHDHARRSGVVNGIDDHEKCHRKEGQQRLPVMHRGPDHMAGEEQVDQRDEMEDHAQAGGVQRDAAEKVAGAAERKEGVDQPHEVARQREA